MSLRDPEGRVKAAWILFGTCLVARPATSLTVFKGEPQGVLALSWLALILSAIQIIVTTDVRNNQ